MSDALNRVIGESNFLKKIMSKLPGFKGYIEREDRRNADKLLRESLADRYEAIWQRISSLQKEAISNNELEKIDDLENSALKIRQFIDRIRTASYGYAGFFDVINVETEELDAIYAYDLTMLDLETEISRAVDNVEASFATDGLPAAIRHLTTLSQKCVDTFNDRNKVIVEMESVPGKEIKELPKDTTDQEEK